MRRGFWTSIACLVFFLFAAVGCGSDDGGSESASQESSSATSETGTSAETETATSPEDEESKEEGGAEEDADPGAQEDTDEPGQASSEGGGDGGSEDGDGGDAPEPEPSDEQGTAEDDGSGQKPEEAGSQPETDEMSEQEKLEEKFGVIVTIKDSRYSPQRIVVERGGMVTWWNKEEKTNHTATKIKGPSYAPNSPNIGWGGDTYTDFFEESGEIEYICTYHPHRMKGYITVK